MVIAGELTCICSFSHFLVEEEGKLEASCSIIVKLCLGKKEKKPIPIIYIMLALVAVSFGLSSKGI